MNANAISCIVCRDDVLYQKTKVVNNKLRRKAAEHNLHFIDNSNLRKIDLNGCGLHLNREGSNNLEKNFLRFINID